RTHAPCLPPPRPSYVGPAHRNVDHGRQDPFPQPSFHLPQSKPIRIGLGILLVACGLVGFLPVVGFWMIPLGLLVLSVDIPIVRRWRRKLAVWWHRDRKNRDEASAENGSSEARTPEKDSAAR